jgi:Na+/proline symporter
MHTIDYAIVAVYIFLLLVAGVVLSRVAGRSSEDYFLGGKRLPWWALGSSGMSSNLDVAGTMTIVTMVYLFGLHGLFIEMRGGAVLPIAVFLAFMGKWHRRSAVMTTAEWMLLRFGDGWQGRMARVIAASTYLILSIAMVVFFLSAGGLFLAEFLPFSPTQCLLGMALVAFIYTMLSGLHGVIWTDVAQSFLIAAAAIYIAVVASMQVSPELLAAWPGAQFNEFLPRLSDPGLAPYELFGFFLLVWLFKGVLEGMGGSGGSAYMAQRFYAARSDKDCTKLAVLWTVLFSLRWPMVLGIAVMAVAAGFSAGDIAEAERLLPAVLQTDFFPAGIRGMVLAAMLAAAMSTFDSTINAGASYAVKDIYEVYRPHSSERQRVFAGYVASFLIVAIGILIALSLSGSVLDIWVAIVLLLFPTFLVPFALRWYWSRFNGCGFAVGILAGFIAALGLLLLDRAAIAIPLLPPAWDNEASRFLLISAISSIASILATYSSSAVEPQTLETFYRRIRPFGCWPKAWQQQHRDALDQHDMTRLVIALPWQILTFLLPMGMVLGLWLQVAAGSAVWLLLSAGLYHFSKARE